MGDPRQTYQQTIDRLSANPTAGNWRRVLMAWRQTAVDVATSFQRGQWLDLSDEDWEQQRHDLQREAVTLTNYYNSIGALTDQEEVGEGWAELARRSLQRVSLAMAAMEAGDEHMVEALSQIAPDIVDNARDLVEGAKEGAPLLVIGLVAAAVVVVAVKLS